MNVKIVYNLIFLIQNIAFEIVTPVNIVNIVFLNLYANNKFAD